MKWGRNMKSLFLVVLLALAFSLPAFALSPQEKATLTALLTEYKAIQTGYSLELTALQNQQVTDKASLAKAEEAYQQLSIQLDSLQTQVNQDKLSLTDLEALTSDLKKQTASLKSSLLGIEFENTILKVGLPAAAVGGLVLGYFLHSK